MSESTNTTTTTPSPFDEEKAKTLNALRGILFPEMAPSLGNTMTSQTQSGIDTANKKGIAAAAGGGVESGDVNLLNNMVTSKGNNNNALNMALQLYGYQPKMKGNATTETNPSGLQQGASILELLNSLYKGAGAFSNGNSEEYG